MVWWGVPKGQEVEAVVGLSLPGSITSPVPLDQLLAQSDLPGQIRQLFNLYFIDLLMIMITGVM